MGLQSLRVADPTKWVHRRVTGVHVPKVTFTHDRSKATMCLLPNRPFVDKSLSPAMSDLRVHANLGLLPERKRPLSVFITSYGIQALAVLLLIQFCVFAPVQVET